jgi:hypothetical protein
MFEWRVIEVRGAYWLELCEADGWTKQRVETLLNAKEVRFEEIQPGMIVERGTAIPPGYKAVPVQIVLHDTANGGCCVSIRKEGQDGQ